MNYTKEFSFVLVFLCLVALIAGCSKEYEVWLYNFSGSPIHVDRPNMGAIGKENSALLYNKKKNENVLFPAILKIRFKDGPLCYVLDRIKVGGYAEYNDSGDLVVRLKLGEDKKIYVYEVRSGFSKEKNPGSQPLSYPVTPKSCHEL